MKVKFLPINKEIEITPEKTLLQAALENHIDIKSICKGKLICAECRVKIVEGESNCLPPSKPELNLIGSSWQLDSRRFACQVRCFGDVTVDLTEQLQRAESTRKNIRGFKKGSRPVTESTAVIDTMILNEKIEAPVDGDRSREGKKRSDRGSAPLEAGAGAGAADADGGESRSGRGGGSGAGGESGKGRGEGRGGGRRGRNRNRNKS